MITLDPPLDWFVALPEFLEHEHAIPHHHPTIEKRIKEPSSYRWEEGNKGDKKDVHTKESRSLCTDNIFLSLSFCNGISSDAIALFICGLGRMTHSD